MFENFRKRRPSKDETLVDPARRAMVIGGLAGAATFVLGTPTEQVNEENLDLDKQQAAEVMKDDLVGPVLIGSYNSGMGNLEKIIKNFVRKYPTSYEIEDMFDGVDIPTGYDVYLGMTKAAMLEEWRPSYKIHGSEYVSKVYGAKKAISIVS